MTQKSEDSDKHKFSLSIATIVITMFASLMPLTRTLAPQTTHTSTSEKSWLKTQAEAKEYPEVPKSLTERDEIIQLIKETAKLYNIPEDLAIDLIGYESQGFNPKAENPNSTAKGLGQWLDSSWELYCEGDVFDPEDAINCTLGMIAKDKNNLIRHYAVDSNTRLMLWQKGWIECSSFESNKYCWTSF